MKKAFSLIELSVVILIIGILIGGITQGSQIVSQMRLSAARSISQSGPVSSIKDLTLWLDSTSEESFVELEASDGGSLSYWYDVNPTARIKKTFVGSSTKPKYMSKAINNLPAVDFDGSSQYFEISYDDELNPNNFTIFVTFIVDNVPASSYTALISNRAPLAGYILYARTFGANAFDFAYGSGSAWVNGIDYVPSIPTDKTKIISLVYNGTNGTIYTDGIFRDSDVTIFARNISTPLRIGAGANEIPTANYFFNGKIGEIIIFSRALKNEERKDVEKYLGQKWGVKVS